MRAGRPRFPPLTSPSMNRAALRVRRYEVENEAVLMLAVPVDPAHPLFQAIRIPRDVVVEENGADRLTLSMMEPRSRKREN